MSTDTNPYRWVINITMACLITGMVLFFYGALVSHAEVFRYFQGIHASVLGSIGTAPEALDIPVRQEVFIVASALIVAAASLDVWRRLHTK